MTLQLVQSQDGRRQRSERSQRAIIEAAVALMEEGTLIPTAQQIADRAGVGIRSLFRHFDDLEALFAAADAMLRASYEALFSASDRSGTLAERITGVSQLYGEGFDQVSQLILSTKAQLWSSPVLTERYAYNQKRLRNELEAWLPEVSALPEDLREAVHAVASFDMWHRLRNEQGLSQEASAALVARLLTGLLNPMCTA